MSMVAQGIGNGACCLQRCASVIMEADAMERSRDDLSLPRHDPACLHHPHHMVARLHWIVQHRTVNAARSQLSVRLVSPVGEHFERHAQARLGPRRTSTGDMSETPAGAMQRTIQRSNA